MNTLLAMGENNISSLNVLVVEYDEERETNCVGIHVIMTNSKGRKLKRAKYQKVNISYNRAAVAPEPPTRAFVPEGRGSTGKSTSG